MQDKKEAHQGEELKIPGFEREELCVGLSGVQ
jgi:hypothetical protein